MRTDWQNDLFRKPARQASARKVGSSQKRERKDTARDLCRAPESSTAVDEEVANLVQKINNAASRNALKAAGKSVVQMPSAPATSSTSSLSSTVKSTSGAGSMSKCCRCITASIDCGTQLPSANSVTSIATAADNSPTSTTIEPEVKAVLNSKLNGLKVNELKLECKKRQLAVSGSKYQIMERLRPYEDNILADLKGLRAKPASSTAPSDVTTKFCTSRTFTTQYGTNIDSESVVARLDQSVIDAVASNTAPSTMASAQNSTDDGLEERVSLRDNSESTVRDIINDYLQQQQHYNDNKNNNKNITALNLISVGDAEPNEDRQSPASCTSCAHLENCASLSSANRELITSCSCTSTLSSTEVTTRNNSATFSFAQMGSGGRDIITYLKQDFTFLDMCSPQTCTCDRVKRNSCSDVVKASMHEPTRR